MNLTKEQLAQNADAMNAALAGKPVQYRSRGTDKWFDAEDAINGLRWNCDATEYRPKPQPVARPWSKPDDVPLLCWIRLKAGEPEMMVIMVANNGIRIAGITCESAFFEWSELSLLEHSTNRTAWKPCTVED